MHPNPVKTRHPTNKVSDPGIRFAASNFEH
jgi:hypothetical protein